MIMSFPITTSTTEPIDLLGERYGIPIYRPEKSERHYLLHTAENLRPFCAGLRELGCYLVTLVANDERELEDHCFKIYHLFSHPSEDRFITLELSLREGRETYPSVADIFPAVAVFEREIADLFGLFAEQQQPRPEYPSYMHSSYPEGVNPLRRNWSQETFHSILQGTPAVPALPAPLAHPESLPEGELFMPVGPIHAGVIEPGNFLFRISGETIEALDILLGYTHKGIERLYQSSFSILEGCQLSEKVCGDSAFAHSLAYCQAAEHLARARIPEEAGLLRALFLELERLLNHVADCAALCQDLALEVTAADMAALRERLARLCYRLTYSRFLRGVNWPGGLVLPHPFEKQPLLFTVSTVAHRFLDLANMLILRADFRERTINTGVLPARSALALGVTGLAARASGLERDFRLQHPFGPYSDPEIQELIRDCAARAELPISQPCRLTGDVFSRFVQRVIEVDLCARLIAEFTRRLGDLEKYDFIVPLDLRHVPNFETGLGCCEGWRGDIVYWLMKDKFEHIFRCKVRDPSMLNWPGLREAVAPRLGETGPGGTALIDFPIINKSFNLSYSGVDL